MRLSMLHSWQAIKGTRRADLSRRWGLAVLFGFGLLTAGGCVDEETGTLFDPSAAKGPAPVINSVTASLPADRHAGITILTFAGQNFSPNLSDNIVFFDATFGTVLSASPTQLVVRVPLMVKDSIQIRIGVRGTELFSNSVYCSLTSAIGEVFKLESSWETASIATDSSGNTYVSLLKGGVGVGVYKVTADTSFSYSPNVSSLVNRWTCMKVGPTGIIYTGSTRNIIFSIPAGGGAAGTWKSGGGLVGAIADMDFDQVPNIWVVTVSGLYRVRLTDKNAKGFPFTGTPRSVRVYDGFVYVAAKRDSLEKVFRYPIVNADSLGAEQEYFDFSSVVGVNRGAANAITFASDGTMYIGTDNPISVLVVAPGGVGSEPLYAGVVSGPSPSFAWGKGTGEYLIVSRGIGRSVERINVFKTSAPYYGSE